ncbi:MAG TPA: alginate lyase family protein, partial [Candidatus Limnocylindrales bacterium]|nr:alginate lyase family protein [Candidatus Limnocylindrales bacterium]
MATERDEGRLPSTPGGSDEPVEGSAIARPAVPRPSDPVRRAILLTPIVAVVVGIVVVIANLPDGRAVMPGDGTPSIPSSAPVVGARGYLVSVDELRQRGELSEAGEEPYASAVADLLEWADGALDEDPEPTQPIIVVGTDNAFVDDARRAYGLGLAYVLSGEERYAAASRRTIRAWVDTATTTADTCHDHGGCHTSLILGRAGAGFAFGADLIEDSESWTDQDTADLRRWMGEVLLPAASERINNWGDAGTFLRVVAADYAGNQPEFERAIAKWRALVDLIEEDGRIPEETRRGSAGILYTQEALQYKLAVARIAERRGIDLWSYVGAGGGSLRRAVDYLADYWHRPEDWPDHPRPRTPAVGPMWELAYARWRDSRWVPIMLDRRPYGNFGHSAIAWTTLTNGIPVEETGVSGASPSPGSTLASDAPATPGPTASPTPSPAAGAQITGLAVRLGSPLAAGIAVAVRWDPPTTAGATV